MTKEPQGSDELWLEKTCSSVSACGLLVHTEGPNGVEWGDAFNVNQVFSHTQKRMGGESDAVSCHLSPPIFPPEGSAFLKRLPLPSCSSTDIAGLSRCPPPTPCSSGHGKKWNLCPL